MFSEPFSPKRWQECYCARALLETAIDHFKKQRAEVKKQTVDTTAAKVPSTMDKKIRFNLKGKTFSMFFNKFRYAIFIVEFLKARLPSEL